MNRSSRIYVAGDQGMVGSAICRELRRQGYENVITRSRAELNLVNQAHVDDFFRSSQPEYVFLAAAKVGGIEANRTRPAEFIRDNIAIQSNVIHSAWEYGATKLLFLGSSCIYPKFSPQPIREESLLDGKLEPTNQPYAIAKIAGIEMCASYRRQYGFDAISLMPTNLYGTGDNFDLQSSHVVPALIRKFCEAKQRGGPVEIWGSGAPRREFLHVDDLANAAVFLMNEYSDSRHINVGVGEDIAIADLAHLIAHVVGYKGELVFNPNMPDGTPRKLLDVARLQGIGWHPTIKLEEGIARTVKEFEHWMRIKT
jgi:GDP-L-fucose synthase